MAADQLELDLERRERSAENIERGLKNLAVGPIQRAVLIHLCLASETDERGLESLTISQSRAAAWISKHVPAAGGKCHDTSVRKAWQFWHDQGVIFVISTKKHTTIKWHSKRVVAWHDQKAEEELPFFNAIGGTPPLDDFAAECLGDSGGDRSIPVVTGGDRSIPVVTGGDSLIELKNKTITTCSSSIKKTTAAKLADLSGLPELPGDVWGQPDASAVIRVLTDWWQTEQLAVRLGPAADDAWCALVGAVVYARGRVTQNGGDPVRLYHGMKSSVKPFILSKGKDAIAEAAKGNQDAEAAISEADEKAAALQKAEEELASLESEHGSRADSMTDEEWAELLAESSTVLRNFKKALRDRGSHSARRFCGVRKAVLRSLDRQAVGASR